MPHKDLPRKWTSSGGYLLAAAGQRQYLCDQHGRVPGGGDHGEPPGHLRSVQPGEHPGHLLRQALRVDRALPDWRSWLPLRSGYVRSHDLRALRAEGRSLDLLPKTWSSYYESPTAPDGLKEDSLWANDTHRSRSCASSARRRQS